MVKPAAVALLVALVVPASAVAAGSWNAETFLASPLREATGPSLAVAPTGLAVAGWQAQQGTFGHVDGFFATRAAVSSAFATGGTRLMVDSAKAHSEGDLGMTTAVNASGKAVIAWVQATFTGSFRVQAVVRAAGAPGFGPVQTLTVEGADAAVPRVAMNAAGQAVLAWNRDEGGTWQVQGAALTAAGTTFTALPQLSEDPAGIPLAVRAPRVAIAPSGAAVVAWESSTAGFRRTIRWARRGAGDGAFGTPKSPTGVTLAADVAAGDDGSFGLTYVEGTGGTGSKLLFARATSGDFALPVEIDATLSSFVTSRVALDAAGNAIIAAEGATETGVGAPTRVGVTVCGAACPKLRYLTTSERAQGLELAANAAGDAVAIWTRSNGTRELIEASLRARNQDWNAPVFVSRTDQAAYMPTVGIDGGGHVTAAWTTGSSLYTVPQATGAVAGATTAPPGTTPTPTPSPGTTPTPTPDAAPSPTPGPDPSPDPGGGGTPAPAPRDTTIDATVKQAARTKGKTSFSGPRIACAEACKVTLTFTAKRGKKTVTAGTATLNLAAGKSATPKVKLTKAAKALLKQQRKLALTGKVVVADQAGNRRTFTVKTTVR